MKEQVLNPPAVYRVLKQIQYTMPVVDKPYSFVVDDMDDLLEEIRRNYLTPSVDEGVRKEVDARIELAKNTVKVDR